METPSSAFTLRPPVRYSFSMPIRLSMAKIPPIFPYYTMRAADSGEVSHKFPRGAAQFLGNIMTRCFWENVNQTRTGSRISG